jgi:hypothetical protein
VLLLFPVCIGGKTCLGHRDADGKTCKFVEIHAEVILKLSTIGGIPARLRGTNLRASSPELCKVPVRPTVETCWYAVLRDAWCKASGHFRERDRTELHD